MKTQDVLGARVPKDRIELLARIASRISAENSIGDAWTKRFEEVLKEGLPLKLSPSEISKFTERV